MSMKLEIDSFDIQKELKTANSPIQKLVVYMRILTHVKENFLELLKKLGIQASLLEELSLKLQLKKGKAIEDAQQIAALLAENKQKPAQITTSFIANIPQIIENLIQIKEKLLANLESSIKIKQDISESIANIVKTEVVDKPAPVQQEIISVINQVVETELNRFIDKMGQTSAPELRPSANNKWTNTQKKAQLQIQQAALERAAELAIVKLQEILAKHRLQQMLYTRVHEIAITGGSVLLGNKEQRIELTNQAQTLSNLYTSQFRSNFTVSSKNILDTEVLFSNHLSTR
jgi:hypothetical protein